MQFRRKRNTEIILTVANPTGRCCPEQRDAGVEGSPGAPAVPAAPAPSRGSGRAETQFLCCRTSACPEMQFCLQAFKQEIARTASAGLTLPHATALPATRVCVVSAAGGIGTEKGYSCAFDTAQSKPHLSLGHLGSSNLGAAYPAPQKALQVSVPPNSKAIFLHRAHR